MSVRIFVFHFTRGSQQFGMDVALVGLAQAACEWHVSAHAEHATRDN